MGISTTAGVLFFGAEGTKPVAWDAIPELVMDDDDFLEEQSKIFAIIAGVQHQNGVRQKQKQLKTGIISHLKHTIK